MMQSRPDKRISFTAARVLLLSFFIPVAGANAEPCRMIGCGNQVFYIFLPDANLAPSDNATFHNSGKLCKGPDDSQTFERKGLPAVNEVASLRAKGRWVYTQQQIEEEADLFQPLGFGQSPSADCSISWEAPDGGGSLDPGMKLQVLGYRTFVGHRKVDTGNAHSELNGARSYPEQLLFAMVVVN